VEAIGPTRLVSPQQAQERLGVRDGSCPHPPPPSSPRQAACTASCATPR
jgi:hypothetical protein